MSETRPTMQDALTRALTAVALLAVITSLIAVLAAGIFLLRGYARENLDLVARQAAWTTEVAVVFNDRAAAADAVRPILRSPGVIAIDVRDAAGQTMAAVSSDGGGQRPFAAMIDPEPVTVPIRTNGQTIGEVEVKGRTTGIALLLVSSLMGAFAALVMAWLATRIVGMGLRRTIVAPLQGIAQVAHRISDGGDLSERAPRAGIAEVDNLAMDFNALVDELQTRQQHVDEAHAQLLRRANFDPLSGLPNRSSFIERIDDAIRAAQRSGENFAVLFMDGDGFKTINDRHGHAAGDAAIAAIAGRITPLLRAGDMAARLGGDEFGALIRHLESRRDAHAVATRIADAMRAPILLPDGGEVTAGLSIGIAVYPDDGDSIDTLIQAADAAMYAAKGEHKLQKS